MEIDVSKADSSDSAADDELRLWSDFSTEAAETASVAEEFASHLDDKLTQGALLVNLASSGEIAIASPTLPSPVAGVSLLSAVLLIVVPWWFRRPSPTPGSDSVVADQRTAITEPTIADSDILESDDSSSRSGFSQ